MGNTNLPQFGAADASNSRDTLSGQQQLTQAERKAHGVGPSPSRPKNAPERIPGQQRDPADDDEGVGTGGGDKRDHDADVERTDDSQEANGDESAAALGGHANTGHSPSGAT